MYQRTFSELLKDFVSLQKKYFFFRWPSTNCKWISKPAWNLTEVKWLEAVPHGSTTRRPGLFHSVYLHEWSVELMCTWVCFMSRSCLYHCSMLDYIPVMTEIWHCKKKLEYRAHPTVNSFPLQRLHHLCWVFLPWLEHIAGQRKSSTAWFIPAFYLDRWRMNKRRTRKLQKSRPAWLLVLELDRCLIQTLTSFRN